MAEAPASPSPPSPNLADAFADQALRAPHAPAVIDEAGIVSYGRLAGAVRRAERAFAAAGWGQGTVVAIAPGAAPMALHLAAALALTRLGAVQAALGPGELEPARFALLRRRFGLGGLLLAGSGATRPPVDDLPVLGLDIGWLAPGAPALEPGAPGGDLPWMILRSSGTTGEPKAFLLTQAQQAARTRFQSVAAPAPEERALSLTPLGFVTGLGTALRSLDVGGTLVSLPPQASPLQTFDWIDRHGVTYVAGTPRHFHDLAESLPGQRGPRLPRLRVLRGNTAALPPRLLAMVRDRLSPQVYASYGGNEIGSMCTAGPAELARNPETVGRPHAAIAFEIVDAAGRPLPPGTPGEVRARAPGLVAGYLDDPAATARAFRDGWYYPGDHAVQDAEGFVVLKGRTDEMMNYDGMRVAPAEIEAVLLDHPAVAEAAAFAIPSERHQDLPLVAVVLRRQVERRELMAHCRARLGARAPAAVMPVAALPRNPMGKVLRRELAARAEADLARTGQKL